MNKLVKLGVLSFISIMTAGCGPQPKPAELIQLEELRASGDTAEINQIAPDAYSKCTDLTNKAIDAWQDGELAQAKTYATLGQAQYATARAESRRREAVARQQAAEAEQTQIKLQMETLQAKQAGLEKSIALMKENIAKLDNANAEHRIQLAITEQEKAKGVEADYADESKHEYADAAKKLKAAGEANAYGRREEASKLAEEAKAGFEKAYNLAKPAFEKKQAAAAKSEKQKALFEDAKAIVGPSYALTDMRTTTLIFAGAFDKDKYEISSAKLDAFKQVAELAKKYSDASISIEGYTQKGTKQYFEVSQRRADGVRDYLISQGVDYKRIMTTARGKESLRYDEKVKTNRTLNDRVEIIISIP